MKHKILSLALCLISCAIMCGCAKHDELQTFEIYWQVYHQPKYIAPSDIESVFQETFFGFYKKVNDNTVRAQESSRSEVRSKTLQLCNMANAKIDQPLDPSLNEKIEVRVFINFGTYVEELWSNEYL